MQRRSSNLRIIGGKWRRRKLEFTPPIRPTTDAIRETIFNWLTSDILDVRCLDLFAGSGALGFEALSRGARHVVMVDAAKANVINLKKTAQLLLTEDVNFYWLKIPQKLQLIPVQQFDLVFLDPPFYHNLIQPTCNKLLNLGYLAQNALVYIEVERELNVKDIIPQSWVMVRQKIAGQVGSYLCRS